MRVHFILFALTLILSISEIYVSGLPIVETDELTYTSVMHMDKREKCSDEDRHHGKCDSHGNTIREEREEEQEKKDKQDKQDSDDSKPADTASYNVEM